MEDQSRPTVTGYPATANGYSSYTTTTAGTAYPYAAPPPQPQPAYYNPPYYPQQPYSSQRATLFRRLFAILIASFIITGTVIFIIWLILRPRLPDFRVDSLSLSNFNVSSSSSSSSSQVTGNWEVSITAQNPNHKIKLYYDQIEAYMYYKSESLSQTSLPPFNQGTRNQTSLRATFASLSTYIDRKFTNDINQERTRGSLTFNVRMLARVRFKAGAWRARTRFLRVYCGDLSVGITTSNTTVGTLVGGSKDCRVGL